MNGQGDYDSTIVVTAQPTRNIVYVGGHESAGHAPQPALHQSPDGGTTWNRHLGRLHRQRPAHRRRTPRPSTPTGNLILGSDGGVWQLRRRPPAAWTDINGNLATVNFNGVATDPNNLNSVFGGSQNNGVEQFTGNPGWTFDRHRQRRPGSPQPQQPQHRLPRRQRRPAAGVHQHARLATWTTILTVNGGLLPLPGRQRQPHRGCSSAAPAVPSTCRSRSTAGRRPGTNLDARRISAIAGRHRRLPGAVPGRPELPPVTDKGTNTYDPNTIYVTERHDRSSSPRTTARLGQPHREPDRRWRRRSTSSRSPSTRRNRDTVYAVSRRRARLRPGPRLQSDQRRPDLDRHHPQPARRARLEAGHRPAHRQPVRRHRPGRLHLARQRRQPGSASAPACPDVQVTDLDPEPEHQHADGRHLRPQRVPALPRRHDGQRRRPPRRAASSVWTGPRLPHRAHHHRRQRHPGAAQRPGHRPAQHPRHHQRPRPRRQLLPDQDRPGQRHLLRRQHLRRRHRGPAGRPDRPQPPWPWAAPANGTIVDTGAALELAVRASAASRSRSTARAHARLQRPQHRRPGKHQQQQHLHRPHHPGHRHHHRRGQRQHPDHQPRPRSSTTAATASA